MTNWYAVHTKSGYEKKVADAIGKKNWQTYLPTKFPKKRTVEPVFPNLIFVNISESEHEWVNQVSGVLNFFYWLQKPAIVPDSGIKMLHRFLNEYILVQVKKMPVHENEKVGLTYGLSPEGQYLDTGQKRIAKLSLPSLVYYLLGYDEITKTGLRKARFASAVRLVDKLNMGQLSDDGLYNVIK